MDERTFIRTLKHDFKKFFKRRIWLYKISDAPIGVKPFDIIGVLDGQGLALECKQIKPPKNHESILIRKDLFKPHQIRALMDFKRAGGQAFGLVCVNLPHRRFIALIINPICMGNEYRLKQLSDFSTMKRIKGEWDINFFYTYLCSSKLVETDINTLLGSFGY